jgi:hypothetical protein
MGFMSKSCTSVRFESLKEKEEVVFKSVNTTVRDMKNL